MAGWRVYGQQGQETFHSRYSLREFLVTNNAMETGESIASEREEREIVGVEGGKGSEERRAKSIAIFACGDGPRYQAINLNHIVASPRGIEKQDMEAKGRDDAPEGGMGMHNDSEASGVEVAEGTAGERIGGERDGGGELAKGEVVKGTATKTDRPYRYVGELGDGLGRRGIGFVAVPMGPESWPRGCHLQVGAAPDLGLGHCRSTDSPHLRVQTPSSQPRSLLFYGLPRDLPPLFLCAALLLARLPTPI
ncbi:hypothetical protein CBR_g38567 [Chara braunii]|uniref:Uncharacterized protein n=1 Tax=Chara braunii TaxID=69332 RepID=A0A388K0C2_CHABU|nr:hypothetical protein CBR_g38567 [Chara braunii]|eukprot:GBG63499.1 hypothetical protein CBR_g38567 [Chara braunii]